MKTDQSTIKILGLNIEPTGIGWALVEETRNQNKLTDARIIKAGVRALQYDNFSKIDGSTGQVSESNNPIKDFLSGKSVTPNASRTKKRGARRNLQRYKLRRKQLFNLLVNHGIIEPNAVLTEHGAQSTHQTLHLRSKAANEEIELIEFARVLFAINKKRGYKSSRKTPKNEEGFTTDGMAIAKLLHDNNLTPSEYALQNLEQGKHHIPNFYQSDLQTEFDKIWNTQQAFYPEFLTQGFYNSLQNKSKTQTLAICQKSLNIKGIKLKGNKDEQRLLRYTIRVKGLHEQLNLEQLTIALQDINNNKTKSSGYLGEICDRSKTLYIKKQTVGNFLWQKIKENPHTSLKNQVFLRQDYIDEFERLWATQAKFHPKLTNQLKEQVRDTVIFFQRKLKSQKGLIHFCPLDSWEIQCKDPQGRVILNKHTGQPKHKTVGHRVAPKSSPIYQEFKIWTSLTNLELRPLSKDEDQTYVLNQETKQMLFNELNTKGSLTEKQILKLLGLSSKKWQTNQPIISNKKDNTKPVDGNSTNAALIKTYKEIAKREGYSYDWSSLTATQTIEALRDIFNKLGIESSILSFNSNLASNFLDKQPSYQLWHALYSAEDDASVSESDRLTYGNTDVNLKKTLHQKFGFKPEYASLLAAISLERGHTMLSARAMRKLTPYIKTGHHFAEACTLAGYTQHSNSSTLNKKKDQNRTLELLPKNSLRNPLVEKVLNQMVNMVNQAINSFGKPDEIRIKLNDHLKKSTFDKAETTTSLSLATKANNSVRTTIENEFGFTPTPNDLIRYKLWLELLKNDGRTILTNKKITRKQLFTSEIIIEHILPRALAFDDTFSNKTLEVRAVNQQKHSRTAFDFIHQDYPDKAPDYIKRVNTLYAEGTISKAKHKKLLTPASKIQEGLVNIQVKANQFIARKAKDTLQEAFKTVVFTSSSVTTKLAADWNLLDIIKDINFPLYKNCGLTTVETRWNSGLDKEEKRELILDWSKHNDYRQLAVDALIIAFTSHNHITYLNHISARSNPIHPKHQDIIKLEKALKTNGKFAPPFLNFKDESKRQILNVLVSHKAKSKVLTRNINKASGTHKNRMQLTPRGQLHKETIYGKLKRPLEKPIKLNKRFGLKQVELILDPKIKQAVKEHLQLHSNQPEQAFEGNVLKQSPILYQGKPITEVVCFEEVYTIRKEISPENFSTQKAINKIIDAPIRQLLTDRLKAHNGNAKQAFSNLNKNPIWLSKKARINVKRVTISGISNAESLRSKKDHFGQSIFTLNGKTIPSDYVATGNNHHVAIYKNQNGQLVDYAVSFLEAVKRQSLHLPIIPADTNTFWAAVERLNITDDSLIKSLPKPGLSLQFSMMQNDYFVFPNPETNFYPNRVDLMDPNLNHIISPNLFRVQKLSKVDYGNSSVRDFVFRHHAETEVTDKKELANTTWKSIKSLKNLEGLVKVRLNSLGLIDQVGQHFLTKE